MGMYIGGGVGIFEIELNEPNSTVQVWYQQNVSGKGFVPRKERGRANRKTKQLLTVTTNGFPKQRD